MFDLKALRDDPAAFDKAWARRGLEPQTSAILEADKRLREAQSAFQAAQARRNEASKLIGAAKAKKDDARAAELMAEVEGLKAGLPRLTDAEKAAEGKLRETLAGLPNLPDADVPDGADEQGNVEVRLWGEPRGIASPKDHVALGEALGMMDFEAAARMSGSRFVVLKKDLARLERALGQFMLDLQTREHGYEEVSPPLLVRDRALFGTGQLPKFEPDLFSTTSTNWDALRQDAKDTAAKLIERDRARISQIITQLSNQLTDPSDLERAYEGAVEALSDEGIDAELPGFLLREDAGQFEDRHFAIPTAEVSLTNLVREQITPEDQLPLRYTALTPCFRSEAGASGRDTRGMIRQHQFTKCELVSITTPEQSEAEHARMVECAEAVLKRLELPFRTMLLCAGDMGFGARKTYDLEVWLPSQATYREISSCSNCGDFQARRMDARIKAAGEKGTRFPHTLNGSGLAVGRTLVAVMENYQDEAGRVAIPSALQPYMGGMTHIGGGT